jgi:hypothetical protein
VVLRTHRRVIVQAFGYGTWTEQTEAPRNCVIASDSTGRYLVAAQYLGGIYTNQVLGNIYLCVQPYVCLHMQRGLTLSCMSYVV